MTDHLWFNYTKGFEALGKLEEGDLIQFDGRCKEYTKGYAGNRRGVKKSRKVDYKISHPTKVKRL